MKKLKWTCPVCGSTKLVMVSRNVTLVTPVVGIECNEPCFDKEDSYIIDDIDHRYNFECGECDYILLKDSHDSELVALIKENKWYQQPI